MVLHDDGIGLLEIAHRARSLRLRPRTRRICNFYPPIFRPFLIAAIIGDRPRLSVALRRQLSRRNTVLDQRIHHGSCSRFRECLIMGIAANVICMSLDLHLERRIFRKKIGDFLQHRVGCRLKA
jgi:hypothetical protein